ncbi:HU family DNA-binding protein [Sulfitobacter aestuarii]|uniref:HU family DNA-binding protein n=1 Tax=Sulfitobacter aestuarii TaxID=2161676 RepID=A0ABW5U7M2_9RHOB
MTKKTTTAGKSATGRSSTTRSSRKATAKPEAQAPAPVSSLDMITAPAEDPARPTLVDAAKPVILGPVLRKKELIATVVERAGVKKKDAKPVIETMLSVLGEALAEDRELALPPLGRVMVRKQRDMPNARIMTVKLRQSKTDPAAAKVAPRDKTAE